MERIFNAVISGLAMAAAILLSLIALAVGIMLGKLSMRLWRTFQTWRSATRPMACPAAQPVRPRGATQAAPARVTKPAAIVPFTGTANNLLDHLRAPRNARPRVLP